MNQIPVLNSLVEKLSSFRNQRHRCKALFICLCSIEGVEGGVVRVVIQEQRDKYHVSSIL